ncbi:MAG TPA: glycosyltransferase family 2 protein [Gaiellaceae bacterium]|nr:glycosyltransferase family 2 protein [Gaiellaceae bacterium]
MSGSELSVVVASVNGQPYLGRCLEALAEHCPGAEVVVADWTDEATRAQVRQRWPHVKLLSFDEPMAVPELRAAGVYASSAPVVALIEDHCLVTPSWGERLLAGHRAGHGVVGGPVRNVAVRRLRDWAAFFCEYSAVMEPMPAGPVPGLPGMNVSYGRAALEEIDDLLREGRWENWLHPRLVERGFALHCEPQAVVEHDKDFDAREFLSQRYHYSRSYAGMRNPELGGKRVLYALGTPLLVPLLYARIARNVFSRRRLRREFLLATPLVLLYVCVWAFGEAVGYLRGGGRSILKVR